MPRITIGADPEFFIRDMDTGLPVPICGLLGGTKSQPLVVGHFGLQEDNVMCEYNIPVCTDTMRYAQHVLGGRQAVMDRLHSLYPNRYMEDLTPSRLFSHAMLESDQAKMFGCSPDFDAYSLGQANRRIDPAELDEARGGWRFSGGHVHVGFRDLMQFDIPPYVAAQFADVFIGLYAVQFDKQGKRRQFYGTAGRYRPTPYGIEYRTLSNVWTYRNDYAEMVGHFAIQLGAFLCGKEPRIKKLWAEIPWMDVKRAIQTEDVALARTAISYCQSLGLEI